MLSLNLLEAVLQGLSPIYLDDHLDRNSVDFCMRIQGAVQNGFPPLEALKLALSQASLPERKVIAYFVQQAQYVLPLTDLSFRQKELLVALRSRSISSAIELSRILNWERSHTHDRLKVLVQKGYAVKFYGEKGPRYFAAERSLDRSVKFQALQVILDFFANRIQTPPAISATTATSGTPGTSGTWGTPTDPYVPNLYTAADVLSMASDKEQPPENTT